MSKLSTESAGAMLADPQAYTDDARLHEGLAHLRAHAPVCHVDVENYAPFWAITKHADIMEIERANDIFTNSPRPVLVTREGDEQQAAVGIRTLIHTDDPEHRDLRAIGANWFRPKAMRALQERAAELAGKFVDKMAAGAPECDFVQQVAVNYPLYMIMSLLGVPERDFASMLSWTQELFGNDDAEFQRGTSKEEQMMALLEMFAYFTELTASRRANPTDDLASTIANAQINGEPLSDIDTVSYYAIVAAAGHDTSSASISGGMAALIQNPDQLTRLQADMSLMPLAVEEMIRWTTPVKEFMRTAQRDYEIRGVTILADMSSGHGDDFIEAFRILIPGPATTFSLDEGPGEKAITCEMGGTMFVSTITQRNIFEILRRIVAGGVALWYKFFLQTNNSTVFKCAPALGAVTISATQGLANAAQTTGGHLSGVYGPNHL